MVNAMGARGTGHTRKDGVVRFRVVVDGERRDYYGPTLAAARAKAYAAMQNGTAPRKRGGQTVAEWLDTWIRDRQSSLRPQTWVRYDRLVRRQLIPAFQGVALADVGVAHVRKLHAILRASTLSGTTQRHAHVVLGTALQAAVRQGLIKANPVRALTAPKNTVRAKTILSHADAERLIAASKDDPYHALYVLALTTGMRIGELLALTWRDINLATGVVTVNGTVTRDLAGDLTISDPKTPSARRQIRLAPVAVRALEQMPTRDGYLFPAVRGGLNSSQNLIKRHFLPLVERAGLPKTLTLHDLRHTCTTHLLEDGVPAHVVSRMLGHASVNVTLAIYAHVTPKMQDAAVAAMEARYSAPTVPAA